MIRAFAVGVGIGTIRIWIGIFTAVVLSTSDAADPLLPDPITFGVAFWLPSRCTSPSASGGCGGRRR